jgi:SAM-dependent methyltransferase
MNSLPLHHAGAPIHGVPRACPVCSADTAVTVFDNRMAACAGYDFSTPIVRCTSCNCAYAGRALRPDDLNRYYTTLSKYDTAKCRGDISLLDRERATQATEFLAPLLASMHSVIDVGCSTGAFLNTLREAGVQSVFGIDPAADAPLSAQAIFSVPVEQAQAERYDRYGEHDLVCLMAVLEHLLDPQQLLGRIARQLKDGGRVLIEIPDAGAFDRPGDIRPLEAFGEFSNEHINYLSISDIARLARAVDLEIERWRCVRFASCFPGLFVLLRRGSGRPLPAADALSAVGHPNSREAVLRYIERSGYMMQGVEQRLRAACTEPVLVYGAGNHTARLMCQSATLSSIGVAAVFDRNRHLQGRTIGGAPILAPERLRDFTNAPVIISTFNARHEIHAALRERTSQPLVLLYD